MLTRTGPSARSTATFLLASALLATGCARLSQQPGVFSVKILWAPDLKPTFPPTVYICETVQGAQGVIPQVGPTPYPDGGDIPAFTNVPNGRNLTVVVTVRDSSDCSNSLVLYYGQSEPFDLEPGTNATVSVILHAAPGAPGGMSAVGIAVQTNTPGYTNTPTPPLTLIPGTAASVQLANTADGLAQAAKTPIAGLTGAPDGGLTLPEWPLLAGLPDAGIDTCGSPGGCPLTVYAQFVDQNEYPSNVVHAQIILDTHMPSLTDPQPKPPAARVGETVVFSMDSDEPLQGDPPTQYVIGTPDGGTPESPPQLTYDSTSNSYQHTVTGSEPNGTFTATFSFNDRAGNPGSSGPWTFSFNSAVPTISHVTTDAPLYSTASGHDVVTLTLMTAPDPDPVTVTATLKGMGAAQATAFIPCVSVMLPEANWSCQYDVTGPPTDVEGSQSIAITATDLAGNQDSSSTSVTFDFTLPTLALPPTIQYLPSGSSILNSLGVLPSAATIQTKIALSFTTSKALGASPQVSAGPLTFTQHEPADDDAGVPEATSFFFEVTVTDPPPPDGMYTLSIALTDQAGNQLTITPENSPVPLPDVVIATTRPPPPNTAPEGPITYVRIPWGSSAAISGGSPTYAISGGAGAAAPNTMVIAFDSPVSTADILGHAAVGSGGSFGTMTLARSDHPIVWLAAADRAGNLSDIVAAHDVAWTSSLNGKVSGSTSSNPHVVLGEPTVSLAAGTDGGSPRAGQTWFVATYPGASSASELTDYSGLFSNGPSPLITTADISWANATPNNVPHSSWSAKYPAP
jgi:hypothetical protein